MNTLTRVAQQLVAMFGEEANEAARACGFIKRERHLTGRAFLGAMVAGASAEQEPTLDSYVQAASIFGARLSVQGFDQRFGPEAAAFLRAMAEACVGRSLEAAVEGQTDQTTILSRFTGVRIRDSTHITLPEQLTRLLPACSGDGPAAGLKLQAEQDVLSGRLHGPYLQSARANDQGFVWPDPPEPGQLCLGDLGYFDVPHFQQIGQAGAFWASRLQLSCAVLDPSGQRLDLAALLAQHPEPVVELRILLGATCRLACRLVAARVPPETEAERRRKLQLTAWKKGRTLSQKRLALVAWNIYVTNVGPERLSSRGVVAVMRSRWQIETTFKVWKSLGHIDESRSGKAWRLLCEVYAKFIAVVVRHLILARHFFAVPRRSLFKAFDVLTHHALWLFNTIATGRGICAVLRAIDRCLGPGTQTQTRRKRPSTYQRLRNPESEALT